MQKIQYFKQERSLLCQKSVQEVIRMNNSSTMRHNSANFCDKSSEEWEVRWISDISVRHNQNLTMLQLCNHLLMIY